MKTILQTLFFFLLITQIGFAQWVPTTGPFQGRVTSLAVSGTNLFACSQTNYRSWVFLSTNNGTSWTAANTPFDGFSQMVEIGTNLFAGTSYGVFLSTNNGASWTPVNTGLTNTPVGCLAVSGLNLFAETEGGVFLTTNNGTSWTAVNNGLTRSVISLAVSGTNLFAGACSFSVFLSTDNGTSWTKVNAGMRSECVDVLAVIGTNLFASTSYPPGIYLSTDNGTSWAPANTPFSGFSQMVQSGENTFAATGGGVFLSTNNGASWTPVNKGLTNTRVISLAVSNTNLFAGTDGGVFLSTNKGTNWTRIGIEFPNANVTYLAISGTKLFATTLMDVGPGYSGGGFSMHYSTNNGEQWIPFVIEGAYHLQAVAISGTRLFAGTYNGVFLSTDNGTSWTASGLTDTSVYALAVSETNLFAGTGYGVFLSTDNGTSWTAVNTGLTDTAIGCLAASGTNLFAGTWSGVFLSTNSGTSWTAVNDGLTDTNITALAVSETNLFAGTWGGGVFLSTNNGTSWTLVNTGLTNTAVRCLAVSETNIFAGTYSGGVFLSTSNGTYWIDVNAGLTYPMVTAFAVLGTDVFAGTYGGGVWRRPLLEMVPVELTSFTASANGKEVTLSWSTATELNNQGFEVQRKFGSNNFVTVGSVKGHGTTTSPNQYTFVDKLIDAGKYIYRLKQIDFGEKYEYSQTVEINWSPFTTFRLEQNYPNPFNPTTTIGFGIPASPNPSEGGALVTLKVYDILGNEVQTLINKEMEAGYHSVEFDASMLPNGVSSIGGYASGVYFYQLRAETFIETMKMILLR
jgi:hypothetical protein